MGLSVIVAIAMWTLTLNPAQLISCDKEIAVEITLCEQPFTQSQFQQRNFDRTW